MKGDGASAVPPLGATGGMPVEVMEARYPVRVESMGLAQDSGGAGARRGGLGVFREYRMLIDGVSASAAGSAEAGPAGGPGASAGKPYEIRHRSGKKSAQAPAVGASTAFSKGDSIRVSTPGGGGWGDPRERDPEEVRADVLRGFVSAKAAEAAYGVVLGGAPGFRVDEDATNKRRQGK